MSGEANYMYTFLVFPIGLFKLCLTSGATAGYNSVPIPLCFQCLCVLCVCLCVCTPFDDDIV